MRIHLVTEPIWSRYKDSIIRFIRLHGENRITYRAIQWLKDLTSDDLQKDGLAILLATEGKMICGVIAVSDFGKQESIIVVHQKNRQSGIGLQLLDQLLQYIDKLYGRVSLDNIPSLKLCLSLGMVGFKLIEGPTGKPTLWLGIGNWKKEDVE